MAAGRPKACPCGTAVQQPKTGRPRIYCSAYCKQHAYEVRLRTRRRGSRSEWWTPPEVLARLRREQGHEFGLDAAACAVSTAAQQWLGPTHDEAGRRDATSFTSWAGLSDGGRNIWCNPPYVPAPVIKRFLLIAAATARDGVPVTALVPAATSTLWWNEGVVQTGAAIEYLTGRVRFQGPHSDGTPAPFASALVRWSA